MLYWVDSHRIAGGGYKVWLTLALLQPHADLIRMNIIPVPDHVFNHVLSTLDPGFEICKTFDYEEYGTNPVYPNRSHVIIQVG